MQLQQIMPFPDCDQAGSEIGPSQRACRSTRLAGLKVVSPELCTGCAYRNAASQPLEVSLHWQPCAYLGDELTDDFAATAAINGARHHRCLNPRHGVTTRDQCASCNDYLFPFLTPHTPAEIAERFTHLPTRHHPDQWWTWPGVIEGQRRAANRAIAAASARLPTSMRGRGIAVIGGGSYFTSAYVTIRVLRHVGCQLPIELWHLEGEVSPRQHELLAELGVTPRDADALTRERPYRFLQGQRWKGWQLKAYALLQSSFAEVLLLDADSYPLRNPEYLFELPAYRDWAAVFWPDPTVIPPLSQQIWDVFGATPLREGELPTESGQLLVNKEICWREVQLAAHYNAQADFTYRWVYGDKDTFPIAWRRLGRSYARLWSECGYELPAILQKDEHGDTLFIHRVNDKFRLPGTRFQTTNQHYEENHFHEKIPLEAFCFDVVRELAVRLA